MDSKRVLVTGGAGFVGSHLCQRLLKKGHRVIALDDLSTGSFRNITHLVGDHAFRFVLHDVLEPFDFDVQWIFNLASPARPYHYRQDPARTTLANVKGTLHALELAERRGARILQASSSEVYGDPEEHPQRESYNGSVDPIGPRACLDEGKRCAESLVMDFHRQHGVDVRIARIFDTYGPKMAHDARIATFILQALMGKPITLAGDGGQMRSACYIDDLIDGVLLLMQQPTEVGPFNLGSPEELTAKQLADLVVELTGSASPIEHRTPPSSADAEDEVRRCPDITRARLLLGFSPSVALREGLARTAHAFADELRLGQVRAETTRRYA